MTKTTTKVTKDKNQSDKKSQKSKSLGKIVEMLKSPISVGIIITLCFFFIAQIYYKVKNQNEFERDHNSQFVNSVFELVEWFDLKNMDGRLKLRGEINPSDKVALLTIDDRTIEEIGRWPWSREKMSFVVEEMMKYGAKAIGFDIVFSEPQIDLTAQTLTRIEEDYGNLPAPLKQAFEKEKSKGQPDQILAKTFETFSDRNILGVFNEAKYKTIAPYQDYCRNEVFRRSNADKFVKLNPTFVVDDVADPFVEVEFDQIFSQIFPVLEKINTEGILKEVFQKPSVEALSDREKAQLKFVVESKNIEYCDIWLTDNDQYYEPLKESYLKIFEKTQDLANVSPEDRVETFKSMVKSIPISQYPRWTINTDEIQIPATYTASFNAEQDSDGSIRRASMFFRTGNRIGLSYIPSLALQTYLVATGYRADVEVNIDPKNPNQKKLTSFVIKDPSKDPEEIIGDIPVDDQGRLKINYAGGTNMYPYLPAKELFNGKETMTIEQKSYNDSTGRWEYASHEVKKAEFIKDKAFIIGATAIGVYDLRVTPYEKNFPGPETHLTALGNLFDRNFLREHPNEEFFMAWALLIFGVILSITVSFTTAIPGFLVSFGSIGGIALLDQYLLSKGMFATMTLPAGLGLSLYVFLFFYKYLTEERKKKHLRSTFSKYVSPAVVDEILKDPENIELGGKKMRMSIFFSDVRGFTTISEKLEPTVLSDVLNLYLTPMTNIVFANKGTLDKYIGDAVMAFFGAPIPFDDHATHACRCALQSITKLKEIQAEFKAKNLPNIDIGIGINSAEVSVGNMGSDIVRSYTVMGDGVNLAARLEGITKEYGVRIVISEFTYGEVKDKFTVRELDWVKVKGKNLPVRIFELISEGKPEEKTHNMLNEFQNGFELFHQKKFDMALTQFKKCLELVPADPPSELYVERCEDYLKEPPPENWDGVVTMKTK
jgi:adenylate cyclase